MRNTWFALALVLTVPTVAHAQTQEQSDNLDRWARYTVNLPLCEKLGMDAPILAGTKGGPIYQAMRQEAEQWGLEYFDARILVDASMDRQGELYSQEFEELSAGIKNFSEERMKSVDKIFVEYGHECVEAANDKFFGEFLKTPAQFELEEAASNFADTLLFGGGLASWQTPLIQARGDMMLLAGACRRQIGSELSDGLRRTYGRSDDARERRYYEWSFDKGLADLELQELDATQCNRAIGRYRNTISGFE